MARAARICGRSSPGWTCEKNLSSTSTSPPTLRSAGGVSRWCPTRPSASRRPPSTIFSTTRSTSRERCCFCRRRWFTGCWQTHRNASTHRSPSSTPSAPSTLMSFSSCRRSPSRPPRGAPRPRCWPSTSRLSRLSRRPRPRSSALLSRRPSRRRDRICEIRSGAPPSCARWCRGCANSAMRATQTGWQSAPLTSRWESGSTLPAPSVASLRWKTVRRVPMRPRMRPRMRRRQLLNGDVAEEMEMVGGML
mmetsp:Transcript_16107/g.38827  ORF Transcript_16107/g.38827 Transcript_16107/m.38827 type:complete len:249 (+) Transcript_16107:700-1446(+)